MVISIDRLFFHLLQFEVNWTFYLLPPVPRPASINCSPVRFVFFCPLSQFHFHFFPFLLVLLSLHFLSFFFLTFYLLPPVPRPGSINCSVRFVFFLPFNLFHFHFFTFLLFYFHLTFILNIRCAPQFRLVCVQLGGSKRDKKTRILSFVIVPNLGEGRNQGTIT